MSATRYRPRTPPPRATATSTTSRPMANFRTNPGSPLRHVDWVLVAAVGLVTSFGALMVYSVTRGPVPPYDTSFVKRVVMFMIIGGVIDGRSGVVRLPAAARLLALHLRRIGPAAAAGADPRGG
jgi:hypothetical protein